MRVIVFLALIVALFAIHLQDHEDVDSPNQACGFALSDMIANSNGALVSGRDYNKSCSKRSITPNANDNTCTLKTFCTNGNRPKVWLTWDIKDAAKKTCCPNLN
jgi:hypothetical protein